MDACSSSETCSNGQCVRINFCGDGNCDSTEDCLSCSSDCGYCFFKRLSRIFR